MADLRDFPAAATAVAVPETSITSATTFTKPSDSARHADAASAYTRPHVSADDFARGCDALTADLRADNDAAARLSVAQVHQLCRTIRDGIETLQSKYAEHANALDIEGALATIGYPVDDYQGHAAVYFDGARDLLRIGGALTQHFPRLAQSIIDELEVDHLAQVITWPNAVHPEPEAA
jgi:hypothetical protein